MPHTAKAGRRGDAQAPAMKSGATPGQATVPVGRDTPAPIACLNTDREIWREREGDYYADSIHVTKEGAIGFNVGGTVIVMPHSEWFSLAVAAVPARKWQSKL